MKTFVEKVDIHITTVKNALPQEKPVAGRFQLSDDCSAAVFKEEEGAVAVFKERNAKRVMRGKNCSVWWNPVDEVYKVHLTINPEEKMCLTKAEWNADECLNFIGRRLANER